MQSKSKMKRLQMVDADRQQHEVGFSIFGVQSLKKAVWYWCGSLYEALPFKENSSSPSSQ